VCTEFWKEILTDRYSPVRPMCTWEDNIKTDFIEKGWMGVGWIHMTQDRD
jgi:hypothetical protein